jgi:hypothetical protein
MIKKQFTLYLENKPGVLANLTGTLAAANINIEGISVAESTDVGLVQLVVGDAKATEKILTRLRIPFTVQNVALVHLDNKPGALARVVSALAKARVNINYVYATGCDCKDCRACYAIISAPQLKKVEQIWNAVKR